MNVYDKGLHIEDETFEAMIKDADSVLQRLLKNMVEKQSKEGSLTIKLDISFTEKEIQDESPEAEGETRIVLAPDFSFAIKSAMNIKDQIKETIDFENMEIVYNKSINEYVLRPITDTYQKSLFDSDYQET